MRKMTVRFIGGRADGITIDCATQADGFCWVSDEGEHRETCRISFNPPPPHEKHYDTYQLIRHWPTLRWYYMEFSLLDGPLADNFNINPGASDAC